ncbi:MAG: hypothetical protein C4542_06855 [Dehalococcoidia bacterium]|nr:MAG: hypothetical protein C4542_06855 [Dehalococcoidia bacterium]
MTRAIIYLVGIIIAEITTVVLHNINPYFVTLGTIFYAVLLVVMIIDAARLNRYYQVNLVISLALVPLIRIFSLVLPHINLSTF